MPQLKDRREDILLFANFFLDQANREMDKQLTGFDDKASRALLEYPWPGNLRQMKNMVRRATLLAQGKFITINELSELKEPASAIIGIPLRNEEAEKRQIIEALRQTGNNKSRAAQLLGIDRKTLYNKLSFITYPTKRCGIIPHSSPHIPHFSTLYYTLHKNIYI